MKALLELLQLLAKEENILKSLGQLLKGGYVIANLKKHGTGNTLIVLGIIILCATLFFFLCDFLFKLLFKIKYLNIKKTKIIDFVKTNKKIIYIISALILSYFTFYLYNNKQLLPVIFIPLLILLVSYYFYYSIKNATDEG